MVRRCERTVSARVRGHRRRSDPSQNSPLSADYSNLGNGNGKRNLKSSKQLLEVSVKNVLSYMYKKTFIKLLFISLLLGNQIKIPRVNL